MSHNGNRHQRLVSIRNLRKTYVPGCKTCVVLDGIDLDVDSGEFLVLLGASGSGKSTLLNLISGIDRADQGQITIDDSDITGLDETRRTLFRRNHIGIVFQFFNLISTLTVLENVILPLELQGAKRHESLGRGRALLERVELADRAHDFPDKLSGGEQQRVAIARALVHEPKLVLADEPTGNLDKETGKRVLDLLLELTRGSGRTLIMATHDPETLLLADRVCRIKLGKLTEDRHEHDSHLAAIGD